MANITTPAVIAFSDAFARPQSDSMAQSYYRARAFLDEWAARGYDTVIPNDTSAVADGAFNGDGRTVITGADLWNVKADATTVVNAFEATSKAMLSRVLKVAVNIR